VNCTRCNAALDANARFCRVCGEQVIAPAKGKGKADEPTALREQTTPGAEVPAAGTSVRTERERRSSLVLVALAVGVAAALLGSIITYFALRSDHPHVAAPATTTSTTADPTTTVPPTTAAPDTTRTTAIPPTTAAPATSAPGNGTTVSDRWIAVLDSISTSKGRGYAEKQLAAIRADRPQAQLLPEPSGDFASLTPGYWVVYEGNFRSQSAADAFCSANQLAVPSQCYGRFLSVNPG
jgi:hypothetical protein